MVQERRAFLSMSAAADIALSDEMLKISLLDSGYRSTSGLCPNKLELQYIGFVNSNPKFLYLEARTAAFKRRGTIDSHFAIRTLTDYNKTMYGNIRIIIKRFLPVTIVEDDDFILFSKFNVKAGYKTLIAVIFLLV